MKTLEELARELRQAQADYDRASEAVDAAEKALSDAAVFLRQMDAQRHSAHKALSEAAGLRAPTWG